MRELIRFIVIIVILFLLLLVAFGLFRLTPVVLLTCGVAVSFMLLALYLFRVHKIHSLNIHGTLVRIITVRFDGQKLYWEPEESQIEVYAKTKLATFASIILGLTATWLTLTIFYKKGAFNGIAGFSSNFNLAVGYLVSVTVIISTIIKSKPTETLVDSIWEQASYLIRRINTDLERIQELCSLETSIKSIAYQLRVPFPVDFRTEIQEFVSVHKSELLSDTSELNKLIERNIIQAEEDKLHLGKANNLYRAAMKLYTRVAIEVNWTGSMPLIKEMEYDYEGLVSENLKSLLQERKWDDFHDVVNEIMRDLQRLRDLAIKYQETGYKEGTNGYKKEAEEEKAYRIMEISPAASDEEIKKAYRVLALNYHPDNAEQTTLGIRKLAEERFKEINWAYDFLKGIRNFREGKD
ncbi:MAG: J domain-containing protein [Planctomycetia bacterium]|nr:J domain-containing protein [Planctomycetia bacterium]